MSTPSIDQFAKVLSKEPDWYSLGVFLGVSYQESHKIKQEYREATVTRCLIEVYQCLERLGKAPSWDSIARNLRAIGNHALAEQIDSTYIHPSLEPPSESSSSNSEQSGAGIPDSVDQTSRAPEVMVPPEVSKQYSSLSRRLTKLYFCVQKAISGTHANIDDVQHIIDRDWGLQPYAGSDATWENVFHRVDKECSMFDDPHVLSDIIDTFLSDNQELSIQMRDFEKEIDSFKSSAKMGDLVELLKKKKKRKRSNSQLIKLKVQEHWSHCKLKNFETAMKMFLGSIRNHLKYFTVEMGCYCISWIIAANIDHASQLLPEHSKELFKIIGVISLQIGEEMVYDSTGEVPGCEVLEAAMLQAIELKNTRAIELLLAVGCSPEVATHNGDHAVTNVVNIRERSLEDGSGGGVDHVCVLGHNEHIEAIIDPSRERPECATCRLKEKQIKQLHMQVERVGETSLVHVRSLVYLMLTSCHSHRSYGNSRINEKAERKRYH